MTHTKLMFCYICLLLLSFGCLGFVRINCFQSSITTSFQIQKNKFILTPRYIIEDVLPYGQNNISQIEDDGYSRDKIMSIGVVSKVRNLLTRVLPSKTQPGVLILVRHGMYIATNLHNCL